jgi:hypothetical protein
MAHLLLDVSRTLSIHQKPHQKPRSHDFVTQGGDLYASPDLKGQVNAAQVPMTRTAAEGEVTTIR